MVTTTTGLATSFIQFTRTSNATVTDRDGKIKWAGHNLLTNSESFDASAWLKTHGTSATPVVTANAAAAPNGTTTADRVDFGAIDAAGDYSVMYQTFTALDTSYTAGVWVKALAAGDVGKKVWLYLFDTANRGQITITLTADWQYVSTTATLTSGTRSFYLSTLGSDFGGSNQAAASVLVWGAHLYRSDLGSMVLNPARGDAYYPTTPPNLLGNTENFLSSWSFAGTRLQAGGAELVSNGNFASGTTTGWTGFNATLSVVSGALRFTVSTNGQGGAYTEITTVPGKTYRLSATFVADAASGNTFLSVGTTTTGSQLLALNPGSVVGEYSGVFVATGTTAYISVITSSGATAGQTNDWDNFSVQEVISYLAPNNLQTARRLSEDTANSQHYIAASVAGGGVNALSVYAKADGRNWLAIYLGTTNSTAWFNLASGATGTVQANVTASITSVGNGWYRCSVIGAQAGAGSVTRGFYMSNADNATTYTGDGTSGIYLWGAQLSDSASLDAYSPVYGAAVTSAAYYAPRLDFDANGSALGLLVEEQRTNLLLHSADFTNAVWDANGGAVTVTANQATAPDGTLTADLLQDNTGNANQPWILQTFSGSAGTTYTFSIWAKAAGGSSATLWLYDNAGSTGATSAITLTSSWQRFTITRAITAGATLMRAGFNSVPIGGIHVWGAQLDSVTGGNAPFATSYIPTGASTATRTADVASVSTQAFPYSASASTLVAAFSKFSASSRGGIVCLGDISGTGSNSINLDGQNDGKMRAFIETSSAEVMAYNSIANYTANNVFKSAIAATTNSGNAAASGTIGGADDTTLTMPTGNNLQIGAIRNTSAAAVVFLNGHIRQITYIPRRLSNAELQARTL